MSQKKKETVKNEQVEEVQEVQYLSDSFVNELWNNYESALARVRGRSEQRQEAYLKALGETRKFSGEFRNTLKDLFENSQKIQRGMLKNITTNLAVLDRNKGEEQEEKSKFSGEWKEVTTRIEDIATTPVKATFDFFSNVEDRFEENNKEYVKYVQERRKSWNKVTDEYVKIARTNHQNFARKFEEGVRSLVKLG